MSIRDVIQGIVDAAMPSGAIKAVKTAMLGKKAVKRLDIIKKIEEMSDKGRLTDNDYKRIKDVIGKGLKEKGG